MTPFFSIIIPVYNVAPYLRECLDSVLAQTFSDWEAICVDDGSTDGSGAILDEYAAKDKRFKIFHTSNGGVSSARNIALDKAAGEWVWFVDGDDALRPCALHTIHEITSQTSNANSVRINFIKGDSLPRCWPADEKAEVHHLASPCDEGLLLFFCGIGTVLIRREAIGLIRFESYPRGEDTVFLLACAKNGFGCIDLRRALYFYRQREGSATHVNISMAIVQKNFECQRRQIENFIDTVKHLDDLPAPCSWGLLHDFCYRTYFGMYFKLPNRDIGKLFGMWLSNLELIQKYYRPPLERRVRIALIKVFRSRFLIRKLAIGRVYWLEGPFLLLRKVRGLSR